MTPPGDVLTLLSRNARETVAREERSRIRGTDVSFVRGDQAEIADVLLSTLEPTRSHIVATDGDIYRYEGDTGLWQPVTRPTLRRTVKGFAGAPKGDNGTLKINAASADGAITLAMSEVDSLGYFEGARWGVSFSNGFVTVETDGTITMHDHAPEHRCRRGHAFDYDPQSPRLELDAFLEELFGDTNEDDRAARSVLIQEFAGACLLGLAPAYQQCLMLIGTGGNGKSELLKVLRAALPDETVVSLAPQLWGERFQVARLIGATANFVDELPEQDMISTGTFKSVVTGEPVHVERKHQDSWQSRFRAGHIFACNAFPVTADLTDGFFRRFALCNLSVRFDTMPGRRLEAGQTAAETCRPGIAAWAIEGASRLRKQGKYTVPPSSTETLNAWRIDADSVAAFIDATCAQGGTTRAKPLYDGYKDWIRDNGMRAVSSKTFATRMGNLKFWPTRQAGGIYYPVAYRGEA